MIGPIPAGRANTPAKKRALLDRVYAAWLKMPNERLGQMLLNAQPSGFFYAEDEALVHALESRLRK